MPIQSVKYKRLPSPHWECHETLVQCPVCNLGRLTVYLKYRNFNELEWYTQCSHCLHLSSIYIKRS